MPPKTKLLLDLVRRAGVLRTRDLDPYGIPRVYLRRLEARGLLEHVGRGLYRIAAADVTEHHGLAAASKRVPQGVVCLLSALRFHGLSTQAPFEVWIAIAAKARTPAVDYPPLRIARMSGAALTSGVEVHRIEGVEVRVFSAAKTVADCFKFRNKIGLDVALETLRDYWRRPNRNADDLWRMAKVCRVANVLRPYLESLS
jgi:predicted transcriptional regulator of viral defense system